MSRHEDFLPLNVNSVAGKEDKKALLERTRAEREARQQNALHTACALKLQRCVRYFLRRRRASHSLRAEFDLRWAAHTAASNKRAAAQKDNPSLESTLFEAERPRLLSLIQLLRLVTKGGRNHSSMQSDDMKLLTLCAAVIKASLDKSAGSERHNLFSFDSSSGEQHSKNWIGAISVLVRLLMERLTRETVTSPVPKDVKVFAVLLTSLCTIIDPTRWNIPGCNPASASASASVAPASPVASNAIPSISQAVLQSYQSLMNQLIYKLDLFRLLRQLLFQMCCPIDASSSAKPVAASSSSSKPALATSSSAAVAAAPLPQRPTAFIVALTTSLLRCYEICSFQALDASKSSGSGKKNVFLVPEVAYLFSTQLLALPTYTTHWTPALKDSLCRAYKSSSASSFSASSVSSSEDEPQQSLFSISLSVLHQLVQPAHFNGDFSIFLTRRQFLPWVFLSPEQWGTIQPYLPHWAQYSQVIHSNPSMALKKHHHPSHQFRDEELVYNVPLPIHLLNNILDLCRSTNAPATSATINFSSFSFPVLHSLLVVIVQLLCCCSAGFPSALLYLRADGSFELDDEEVTRFVTNQVGLKPKQTIVKSLMKKPNSSSSSHQSTSTAAGGQKALDHGAFALHVRSTLLKNLEICFTQATLASFFNLCFQQGQGILKTRVKEEGILEDRDFVIGEDEFNTTLKTLSLFDVGNNSSEARGAGHSRKNKALSVLLRSFQVFQDIYSVYTEFFFILTKLLQDLRGFQLTASVAAMPSSVVLEKNGSSWLSFNSIYLRIIQEELRKRLNGIGLNEQTYVDPFDFNGADDVSSSSKGGKKGSKNKSSFSAIKSFFGFSSSSKKSNAVDAAANAGAFSSNSPSSSSSTNQNLTLTNRSRYEMEILTSRNYLINQNDDGSNGPIAACVSVTDLFVLYLSVFLPILFIIEDSEIFSRIPFILASHISSSTAVTNANAPANGLETLVSLVHLLKSIVFRLIWNKYEGANGRGSSGSSRQLDYLLYADLLEPCQRILRELYQRDCRANFMHATWIFMQQKSREEASASLKGAKDKSKTGKQKGAYSTVSSESVEMESFSSSGGDSAPVSPGITQPSLQEDDAYSLEQKGNQWLLSSGSDMVSREEMKRFEREFEVWTKGSEVSNPDEFDPFHMNEPTNNAAPIDASQLFDPTSPASQRFFHLLYTLPFILPFPLRVELLKRFIKADAWKHGYRNNHQPLASQFMFRVRRNHVLEDGLDAINRLGPQFKHRLRVTFIDTTTGEEEKGIDLGGVSKEFIEEISKQVFRVEYGLFTRTDLANGGMYYPNPNARVIHGHDTLLLLRNIGRIVGKAIQENILLDIPFANFFLNRFISQGCVLSDLKELDDQLYKNLMLVKNYPPAASSGGGVSDLGLTFTVDTDYAGQTQTHDLLANGSNIDVTDANKILYVYKVAHFHLTQNLREVSEAFLAGLAEIVPLEWFKLFNAAEMRMILSGSSLHDIDVGDWKQHTIYEECSSSSRQVVWFWEVVSKLPREEKQALLKFCTSCSRAPLQGFRELNPPFAIRIIPVLDSSSSSSSSSSSGKKQGFFSKLFSSKPSHAQLPSAATCFNTLKIPSYGSKSVLEEKLRIAIQNNTGFHLT